MERWGYDKTANQMTHNMQINMMWKAFKVKISFNFFHLSSEHLGYRYRALFVYSGFIIIDNQPHPWSTLTSSQSLYWSSLRMFVASSHRREIWDGGKLCATNIFSVNEDDGMWNLWCSWRKRIFDEKLGRKKEKNGRISKSKCRKLSTMCAQIATGINQRMEFFHPMILNLLTQLDNWLEILPFRCAWDRCVH